MLMLASYKKTAPGKDSLLKLVIITTSFIKLRRSLKQLIA
jgi:hypothetical protein